MSAASFEALFGRPPAVAADAPGRVNLIGEHTDYNDGFVLPVALPLRTRVELAPRDDARVRVASATLAEMREYVVGDEAPQRTWLDYVQGLTHVLTAAGWRCRGFDARIESALPVGSGLSSSAALEIAMLRALRRAFDLGLDDLELARVGQRAEHELVGARVGIMDQMTASLGEEGSALFIDSRSLSWRRVPLPEALELVVIDSGVTHDHAAGGYNARRAECERACGLLGVSALRDLGPADLPRLAALPAPLDRRARHVVTENARVLASVAALERGEFARLGALLTQAHASLRDDFEVSVPAIDALVELARGQPDVYGARLTGGGFGGAVVVVARRGRGAGVGARVAEEYRKRAGVRARLLVPIDVAGCHGPDTVP